jgi:hypothetical protein
MGSTKTNRIGYLLGAILLRVSLMVGLSCSESGGSKPQTNGEGDLTFTRQDGSAIIFPDESQTWIWCGDWEPGYIEVPALNILVVGSMQSGLYWKLRAVTADFGIGDTLTFPNHFIFDSPDSVSIFLLDSPNELNTNTEDATGTIVFHKIPCQSGNEVDFTIDAVLGSEFGEGTPVVMRGRYSGEVTGAPSGS